MHQPVKFQHSRTICALMIQPIFPGCLSGSDFVWSSSQSWGATYSMSHKSSLPKTSCNIFTQAKYFFVKFCQFVASLHPHICTNFGLFILIFNKMALIFLGGVLIVFTVSSFDFQQVRLCRQWWVACNTPNLSLVDYQFWGNAEVLSCTSCNRSQKQFPSSKMHFSRFGLPYGRKPLTTRCDERLPQWMDCRHVC